MYSERSMTSSSGFLPLLTVSPPPSTSVASPWKSQPQMSEEYSVYGFKLWRWKISFQIPRRYAKVAQQDEEEEKWKFNSNNSNKQQISKNLRVNNDFFKQIEFPMGEDQPQAGSRVDRGWEFEAFSTENQAFNHATSSTENLFCCKSETSLFPDNVYSEIDNADVSFDPRTNPPLPPRSQTSNPPAIPPRGRAPRRRSNIDQVKVKRSKSAKH